ncbi:MAG: penicillin acylase family protein [Actinomycetota bacterium]
MRDCSRPGRRAVCGLLVGLMAATVALCPAVAGGAESGQAGFRVTIRRTTHGTPHILADSYANMGFGYGYAFAQDNICVIADSYVTVNAQRSKFFGPDASWTFWGNETPANNLNSDFFFKQIMDEKVVEKLIVQAPPKGPRPEIKEAVRGYVAGYNKYLRETGVDNIPDPACRGAKWVREITEMDVYRRFHQLGLLASSGVAIDGIGGAQPPTPTSPVPVGQSGQGKAAQANVSQAPSLEDQIALLKKWTKPDIGSNAFGLGKDATDNGHGMLLGNPHFPWQGSERFYQAHLTIPGKLNVSGAGLFGVPLVLIGYTEGLAWSHTVSTAYRFTPFELKLVPGSPTTYLYDGQPREMTRRDVTVEVKNADGSIGKQTRTLYSSHHGSILTSIMGLPLFPWTPTTAYAMGDANFANFRYLNHFFDVNHAQSVKELHEILKRDQGVPWVNTIAADSTGKAFYADITVVPHVTDEKVQTCVNGALGLAAFQLLGLPILDGSQSACEWGTDPDAIQKGTFGPSHMPFLYRDDYVTNSNDSYWLSNPKQPLTGFDRIIGDEGTARTLRTRLGLVMVEQRLAGTDGRPGNRFTLQQLQDTVFNNRQYAGELLRDELAAYCQSLPGGMAMTRNGPVDVSDACPVLAAWNLRDDLDSKGAILFRRFVENLLNLVPLIGTPVDPYANDFDASDAVHTPNGLDTTDPLVQEALGMAVSDLQGAGIPLDAPLRGWQYKVKNGEKIPIHGGPVADGLFNSIEAEWNAQKGYPDFTQGSSFVQVVQFDGTLCPKARTILTYSLSSSPESPYYADQTRMYSNKQWNEMAFCEKDVLADRSLKVTHLSQGDAGVMGGGGRLLPATGGGVGAGALACLAAAGLAIASRRSRRSVGGSRAA